MKTTTWWVLAGALLILLAPHEAQAGACTCARFHDCQDCGCPILNAPPAGPSAPKSCSDCGMPRWWIDEPYINLHISDTPLSYKTASGKEMDFQLFYRIRAEMPEPDESSITIPISPIDVYYPKGANCGTNAFWSHNWNMSLLVQATGANVTPAFSLGYTAVVFRPDGGMEIYTNFQGVNYGRNPSSQAIMQDVSGLGYPLAEELNNYGTLTNQPSCDTNGIYWGDSGVGLKLVYPDGSQDVFGLSCYWTTTTNGASAATGANFQTYGAPQVRLLLTQRISPQGQVTSLGYEFLPTFTNWWHDLYNGMYGIQATPIYRLRYVVDEDGRTNTFVYNNNAPTNSSALSRGWIEDTTFFVASNAPPRNPLELVTIEDPYGRKAQLGYDMVSALITNITDAAGLTSYFQYNVPAITKTDYLPDPQDLCEGGGTCPVSITGLAANASRGWITNLITPYGSNVFNYYEVTDSSEVNGYQQRAIYVNEPQGQNQLYYYLHVGTPFLETTAQSPNNIPGVTNFDNGTTGSTHFTLDYRNTIYWGRRQFAALSTNVQALLPSNMTNALAALTANDFRKGRVRNWLWQADSASISECLSSEREPSPDAAGQIEDTNRIWYSYIGQSSTAPEVAGSSPQIACVAKMLPDGTSQYTTYNYFSPPLRVYPPAGVGLVSSNAASYSRPDGSIGEITTSFTYAANGVDLVCVSNSAGQSVNYGYANSHILVAITNALQQVTAFSWGAYDNLAGNVGLYLIGIQLPSGESMTLNRDYYDNGPNGYFPVSIIFSPSGRCFTNTYFASLPTSITDDRGVTVSQTWDGLNRFTGATFPDSTSISNIYDRLDLVATQDRLTNWTYYGYDSLQHLIAVTNANKAVTTYGYCGCGSLTEIIDAQNGPLFPTWLNYDNQGNLTNVSFPDGSSLYWQFDQSRRITKILDGANRYVQLAYNNQGLVTEQTTPNGTVQSVIYDAVNRPISVTDANGVTVTNAYDAINELINRVWPDGNGEGFVYSTNGLIAYTNRDGEATHYTRDRAGRLLAVTNANHEVTQFAYDSLDNVTKLVDGNTNQTHWQYNQYGWLTNKLDGIGRTNFTYARNANGWIANRWTPEKGNTAYTYDGVGNLKIVAYPNQTNTYLYDALNRRTNMVDALGSHSFAWTRAGQLASENDAWTTNSWIYVQKLRTAMTIGGTWSQGYNYDSGWRLQSLSSPAGGFGYSYNFQPASTLVTTIALPNGASVVNSYDNLARLTGTDLNNYWDHTLDGYNYTPDLLGLRTNIVRNLGLTTNNVNVNFDKIGQLTSWSAEEASGMLRQNEQLAFAYDPAHNLHTRTNGGLSQTFTTDAANQLNSVGRTGGFTLNGAMPVPVTGIAVNGQAAQVYGDFTFACTNLTLTNGINTFTIVGTNLYQATTISTMALNLPQSVNLGYDNNGNLTNDGALSFGYDCENQLTNITLAGNWRSDFLYDGLNRRRIERDYEWTNSAWLRTNEVDFVYDGFLLVQERTTNGNVIVTYTRGLDISESLSGDGGIGGLLARTDTNGTTFYHSDGNGNITALMDGSENIAARYLYSPFGKLLGQWGPLGAANEMLFSSMQRHSFSGLSLYSFRSYDPNLQRWLNQDPIGEWGGLNLYGFLGNNPINKSDPNGEFIVPLALLALFVAGEVMDTLEAAHAPEYEPVFGEGNPFPHDQPRLELPPLRPDPNRPWTYFDPLSNPDLLNPNFGRANCPPKTDIPGSLKVPELGNHGSTEHDEWPTVEAPKPIDVPLPPWMQPNGIDPRAKQPRPPEPPSRIPGEYWYYSVTNNVYNVS